MTVTWLQVWLDKVNINAVRNQCFCTRDHHDVVLCVVCVLRWHITNVTHAQRAEKHGSCYLFFSL
jgi:hypothetical protein